MVLKVKTGYIIDFMFVFNFSICFYFVEMSNLIIQTNLKFWLY